MKFAKILYWICFILGAVLCVTNFFVNHFAITFSAFGILIIGVIAYFIDANRAKKESGVSPQVQKSEELKKQREDSYKRIREKKKAEKANKIK
jgi:hypothetical protein